MTSTPPPPPPPADPGAAHGFFDSLRQLNLPRSQERWIGGVAGGIAARLGLDPLIVRGIFLVITIFGGFGLLVYGLCWALLPEAADGRIHLQEAIRGRFDAALVGATVLVVIGLSRVGFWWDGWVGIPFMIGMIALVALAIVVITAIRKSGSSTPPHGGPPGGGTPPPGGGTPPPTAPPSSGGAVPFPTGYSEQNEAAGFSAAPGTQTRQLTPGEPSVQGSTAPWADAHAGGPWADEGTDAGPPDAAHPATQPAAATGATGAPAGPSEDSETLSGEETDTSTDPTSTPHLGADATPTVAYPEEAAYTSAATDTTTPQPSAWAEQPETGGESTWPAGAGATPPATPPPSVSPPPEQPPKPPRRNRPGPGRVLVRVTFGLALLAIAGLVLAAHYFDWQSNAWLVALGGALVVLGLGATLAGLLGRRSASLGVVGTLLAIVLVPWAISAPVLTQYNLTDSTSYGDRYWAPQTADQAADGYSLAAGSIRVDLGSLADEPVTSPIDIELGAGDVQLVVPDGMPVAVTASVQGETTVINLSGWSAEVNGEPRDLGNRTELGWRFGTTPMIAELSSPEAEDATPIPVNIDVGFGAIEVREQR